MNQLTSQQKESLKTWSDQRDALLRDVSLLQNEKSELIKINKELGQSNSELQNQISIEKGRLIEIKEVEDRFRNSVSRDITDLISQKSKIEEEIVTKKVQLGSIEEKKKDVITAINTLIAIHDQFFDKVSGLEEIVDTIKNVNKTNFDELSEFTNKLKKSCESVIELNSSNVAQTKIILEKLPKYIFELQKPIPVRRVERRDINNNLE